MIKSFFKTFNPVPNFGFLKACYDAVIDVYNKIANVFSSKKNVNSVFFTPSKTKKEHVCTAGCGLAGCSYGEKHQSPSYKKAQGLFFAESLPSRQRSNSFSYVYCQEGSNVRRRV